MTRLARKCQPCLTSTFLDICPEAPRCAAVAPLPVDRPHTVRRIISADGPHVDAKVTRKERERSAKEARRKLRGNANRDARRRRKTGAHGTFPTAPGWIRRRPVSRPEPGQCQRRKTIPGRLSVPIDLQSRRGAGLSQEARVRHGSYRLELLISTHSASRRKQQETTGNNSTAALRGVDPGGRPGGTPGRDDVQADRVRRATERTTGFTCIVEFAVPVAGLTEKSTPNSAHHGLRSGCRGGFGERLQCGEHMQWMTPRDCSDTAERRHRCPASSRIR